MNRVPNLCYALLATSLVSTVVPQLAHAARPNIIVFYTDDHGYADLSCQDVVDDIKTPHVDELARRGVRAWHGYSTAPQCVPSRAGLLVGKFQSRFGVEANGHSLAGFDRELTIAERLQATGYVTAQFGKWHLGPGPQITDHGFRHVFNQNAGRPFAANITLDGKDRPMSTMQPEMYHIDACSRAAAALIDRYHDKPFFLYVAYRAPHVPLDAPQKYLNRFPGKMPERRRQALAMLSAVDDGVGLITSKLKQHGLSQETLVFYIGDNGAPLKIHKLDAPGGGPGWDGSLNDPLNGEKGMLSEGGMHVPFVVAWPGTIPAGQGYRHPISALDVAATAAAVAELKTEPEDLDGVNLIPHLTGHVSSPPHDRLTWRWLGQSAIREGRWKLLRGGDREYLYDLDADLEEKHNLLAKHPEVATRLRQALSSWAGELNPPGLAIGDLSRAASDYFDFYLEGKPPSPPRTIPVDGKPTTRGKRPPNSQNAAAASRIAPWLLRNGKLARTENGLVISSGAGSSQTPFLTRNGVKLTAPVTFKVSLKAETDGFVTIAWRTDETPRFEISNQVEVPVGRPEEWQLLQATLISTRDLIHVRIHFPGKVTVKNLQLIPAAGQAVALPK